MAEYQATSIGHDELTAEFETDEAAADWAMSLLSPARPVVTLDKRVTDDPTVYPWEKIGRFERQRRAD